MEPKNYNTIRSILKKEQGEKIAPYIFKINDTQALKTYLRKNYIWDLPKPITSKRTLSQNYEEFKKKRKLEEK